MTMDKELQEAIELVEGNGGNVTQAAKLAGVPRKTMEGRYRAAREQYLLTANETQVKKIRDLEGQLFRERGKFKTEQTKRVQAEDDLGEYTKREDLFQALASPNQPSESPYTPHVPTGQATAIVVLTDWHYEEQVDGTTLNGLNNYNLDVARSRVDKVMERTLGLLDSQRRLSKIDDLVLACLGDFMTGYIHEELEENNFLSPIETVLVVQERLISCIDFLLKHADVKHITIPTSYGNHGRCQKRPRFASGHKNSYEWGMYKSLERYYRNEPRVIWKIEDGYHNYLDVQGKKIRFHHGDGMKYGGGVGGITIPVNKAIAQWNKGIQADLDVFGHFHQFIRTRNFICCNCLIGFNSYAIRIRAEFADPSQTFIVIDKKRPGAVDVREIYCD